MSLRLKAAKPYGKWNLPVVRVGVRVRVRVKSFTVYKSICPIIASTSASLRRKVPYAMSMSSSMCF